MPVHIGPGQTRDDTREGWRVETDGEIVELNGKPVNDLEIRGIQPIVPVDMPIRALFTVVHNSLKWTIVSVLLMTTLVVSGALLMLSVKGCDKLHEVLYR